MSELKRVRLWQTSTTFCIEILMSGDFCLTTGQSFSNFQKINALRHDLDLTALRTYQILEEIFCVANISIQSKSLDFKTFSSCQNSNESLSIVAGLKAIPQSSTAVLYWKLEIIAT